MGITMTEERPDWVPADVDVEAPSAARVYDYFLGGAHNFAIDRALAGEIARMTPNVGDTMRAGRDFLRRAVRYLIGAGIRQFLDIGSGIPTVGNVHEIAQHIAPEARIVYVDIDPVAVAHSQAILAGNDQVVVLHADVCEPQKILADPQLLGLLDLSEPVGILLAGIMHFVHDEDDPLGIVAQLRDAVVPGSYLVISHVTYEDQPPEVLEAQKLSARTATEIVLRSKAQILEQFRGVTLIEPGLVHLPLWRPDAPGDVDEHPERFGAFGGVGRKD
jgi:SAM-dependent methyltransferase